MKGEKWSCKAQIWTVKDSNYDYVYLVRPDGKEIRETLQAFYAYYKKED